MKTRLAGEYWITDNEVWFADGKGNINHEDYALEYIRRAMLEELNVDADEEVMGEQEFDKAVVAVGELEGWGVVEDYSSEDLILKWHNEGHIGLDRDLLDAALGKGNIQNFAMQRWGWLWLKQMWIGTHTLTEGDFKKICEGMCEALEQEGGENINPESEVRISVVTLGKSYLIKWKDIESNNYSALGIEAPGKCVG